MFNAAALPIAVADTVAAVNLLWEGRLAQLKPIKICKGAVGIFLNPSCDHPHAYPDSICSSGIGEGANPSIWFSAAIFAFFVVFISIENIKELPMSKSVKTETHNQLPATRNVLTALLSTLLVVVETQVAGSVAFLIHQRRSSF